MNRSVIDSGHRQRGSMTVELAVVAPIIGLFALFAVGMGRYELARIQVVDAARAAADAAAVVSAPGYAATAASAAAVASLQGEAHKCPSPTVTTDLSKFAAGGDVSVTVQCRVELSDLLVPGLPGTVEVHAVQIAPIDQYRMVQ